MKKKVVVFGGAGFLGSHVADNLTDKKYDVTIFDTKTSPYIKENQKIGLAYQVIYLGYWITNHCL